RIGGEEFVLALGHSDRNGVQTALERVRRQIERRTFTFGAKTLNVTASFGVSSFQGKPTPEFKQLLREADGALYAAKRHGRNRIEFAATDPIEGVASNSPNRPADSSMKGTTVTKMEHTRKPTLPV